MRVAVFPTDRRGSDDQGATSPFATVFADIALQMLLLFFAVAAQQVIAQEKAEESARPVPEGAAEEPEPPVILEVDRRGAVLRDGSRVADSVRDVEKIKIAVAERRVVVRFDRAVPYGDARDLFLALREAGVDVALGGHP